MYNTELTSFKIMFTRCTDVPRLCGYPPFYGKTDQEARFWALRDVQLYALEPGRLYENDRSQSFPCYH